MVVPGIHIKDNKMFVSVTAEQQHLPISYKLFVPLTAVVLNQYTHNGNEKGVDDMLLKNDFLLMGNRWEVLMGDKE